MVAIIKTGSSIHRTFNYNEQKVKEGKAQCIMASNYPKDFEYLTISNKINRLINQAALNQNVISKSVHISLNFDPSENLSHDRLREIADTYMSKIGFEKQPYLVYEHHDAGHPHIHIVSIKVRADGSRIDMQNIGRNQSETARKEIEESFGLVKATDKKHCNWNPDEDAIVGCGTSAYHGKDKEVPIIYGDYFFIEGILRLLDKDFLIW